LGHELGFSLYLITDRALVRGALTEAVEECLAAGLRAVQVREKALATRDLLALAEALRESTRRHGAQLIVNDRADVALAAEADGVQRTYASLPVAALRRIAPRPFLVGASVHSEAEARQAEREGADFVVFGPVYDTSSKRQYGPPQGLQALERAARAVSVPLLAVGGITPHRVAEVLAAGAGGVAVISAILGTPRPADAVKAFLDALGRA
jgi:thiamine-phosphate pyrophosphorylase